MQTLLFPRANWPVVHLKGRDTLDFLNRLSSQKFKGAVVGDVLPTALLEGTGHVVCLCLAHVTASGVDLFVDPLKGTICAEYLRKLLFSEDVNVEIGTSHWTEVYSESDLSLSEPFLPAESWGTPHFLVQHPPSGRILSEEEYFAFRAFHLFPRDGVDIQPGVNLVDLGLLSYFHRNKGCYPGQEVLEKIMTYGRSARRLVLFEFEKGSSTGDVLREGVRIGLVTSCHKWNGKSYGLGTVQRKIADLGLEVKIGGHLAHVVSASASC